MPPIFRAPVCECGHSPIRHTSAQTSDLRVERGLCLVPACSCDEYREAEPQHKAAAA